VGHSDNFKLAYSLVAFVVGTYLGGAGLHWVPNDLSLDKHLWRLATSAPYIRESHNSGRSAAVLGNRRLCCWESRSWSN